MLHRANAYRILSINKIFKLSYIPRLYCRWRHSFGVDKAYYWHLHLQAHKSFRRAVAAAKRLSWKNFRASLEKDFTKATATMARLKRRKESTATYSHPDGPQASVDTMASHLASVYDGSPLWRKTWLVDTKNGVFYTKSWCICNQEQCIFH
jgi:hypothetical protein